MATRTKVFLAALISYFLAGCAPSPLDVFNRVGAMYSQPPPPPSWQASVSLNCSIGGGRTVAVFANTGYYLAQIAENSTSQLPTLQSGGVSMHWNRGLANFVIGRDSTILRLSCGNWTRSGTITVKYIRVSN